jgi:hypothetical protein
MTILKKPFIIKDQTVSFLIRQIGARDFYYSQPLDLELFCYSQMFDEEWLSMEIHEYFYDDEFEFCCTNHYKEIVQPLYKILKEYKS